MTNEIKVTNYPHIFYAYNSKNTHFPPDMILLRIGIPENVVGKVEHWVRSDGKSFLVCFNWLHKQLYCSEAAFCARFGVPQFHPLLQAHSKVVEDTKKDYNESFPSMIIEISLRGYVVETNKQLVNCDIFVTPVENGKSHNIFEAKLCIVQTAVKTSTIELK
jgi:hypothetical protein